MKNYYAHFTNKETTIMMAIDGISDTHAYARAWIKFMKTKSYKENPKAWELEELQEDKV